MKRNLAFRKIKNTFEKAIPSFGWDSFDGID